MIFAAASAEVALAFVELGAMALGLSVLARISDRFGLSPIPAYLLVGLAFGKGGLVSPDFSAEFIELAAEIGVLLLLLTLGLEYTGTELAHSLGQGWRSGLLDFVASFTPGLALGLVLGWGVTSAVLLGGITYISSSGIIAKVLSDLDRLGNRETGSVLSILVIEDLVMAVYLPIVGVLLVGETLGAAASAVAIALAVTAVVMFAALRYGERVSALLAGRTDESVLLGVLGLMLVVAGVAQTFEVSSAVGAFLVGIAVSGPVQERAEELISPLRDLFAALFFLLFGLQIDPAGLPAALPLALGLAVVTALTKVGTGWWAARRRGIGRPGRIRAGLTLVARGEFSIVIAGLAVGGAAHPDLVPLAAAYVLILASVGPVLARFADDIGRATARSPQGSGRVRTVVPSG